MYSCRTAGSYGSSTFRFLMNVQNGHQSGWTSLHCHQQCWGFPFLHTLSSICCLYIFGDGHSDWCDVIPHVVVLICISPIISNVDVGYLFLCLLAICMSSLEKCLLRSSTQFWLDNFFFLILHELFVYFGDQSLVSCFICKYFLPFWGLSFVSFMISFTKQK